MISITKIKLVYKKLSEPFCSGCSWQQFPIVLADFAKCRAEKEKGRDGPLEQIAHIVWYGSYFPEIYLVS